MSNIRSVIESLEGHTETIGIHYTGASLIPCALENKAAKYQVEHFLKTGNWISQAEAARLRGVTRQAIAKLVRQSRLRILTIGGHKLVRREDVEDFQPRESGRPRAQEKHANNCGNDQGAAE